MSNDCSLEPLVTSSVSRSYTVAAISPPSARQQPNHAIRRESSAAVHIVMPFPPLVCHSRRICSLPRFIERVSSFLPSSHQKVYGASSQNISNHLLSHPTWHHRQMHFFSHGLPALLSSAEPLSYYLSPHIALPASSSQCSSARFTSLPQELARLPRHHRQTYRMGIVPAKNRGEVGRKCCRAQGGEEEL